MYVLPRTLSHLIKIYPLTISIIKIKLFDKMTCLLPQLPERVRFIGTALGIFIFYFFFGIVQEKITRGRYGQNIQSDGSVGERFTYAFGLVWVQCFFNMLFSKGISSFFIISIYLGNF